MKFQRPATIVPNLLCVSSEAAFVMRVGLSMGEVEQPSSASWRIVCCVALRGRVVNTFGKLSAGFTTGESVRADPPEAEKRL